MIHFNTIHKAITTILLLALGACSSLRYQVKPEEIAQQAEANEGSTEWAKDQEKKSPGVGKFPKNSWKCNLFVYDMLYNAGANPPKTKDVKNDCYWPLTASGWTGSVSGFTKVSTQERGDIVSSGSHVGVAIGAKTIICAGEEDVHRFTFKAGTSLTIQRYN